MGSAIYNLYVNVSSGLPIDTSAKMGENFIYNAAINTLLTGNPYFGAMNGLAALMASFFDSLSSSLIRNIFEIDALSWYNDYAKKVIVLELLVIPFFPNINIIFSLFLLSIYQLFQGTMFSDVKIDKSSFVFIMN